MRVTPAMMAAALLSSGCSWVGLRRTANDPEECTTSVGAPVVDLLVGGISLAAAISVSGGDDRTSSASADRNTAATGLGLAALASVFSAGYGFIQTTRCRQAKGQLQAQLISDGGLHIPALDEAPAPPDAPDTEADTEAIPAGCDAPFFYAVARAGTNIYEGPDLQTRVIATVEQATLVCAANRAQGFGLRKIRIEEIEGFVEESSLSK